MKEFNLSVIIPCYRETENLQRLLPLLFERNREPFLEIIVVDSSEDTSTLNFMKRNFKFCKSCTEKSPIDDLEQVILCKQEVNGQTNILKYKKETKRERAYLMNKGREFATGNVLFFLFADIIPPNYYSSMILDNFREGYRFLAFEHEYHSELSLMPFIEKAANFRLWNLPWFYGDHGISITDEFFDVIGGFPDVPIFEDALFTIQANQIASLKVIKERLIVSDRKYRKYGPIRVTLVNMLVTLLWQMNLDLKKVHRVYRKLLGRKPDTTPRHENLLQVGM